MMRIITILLVLLTSKISFGQDFKYKDKQYDLKIYEYLDGVTDKESTSLEAFLSNSKPFSKWDIRPLKVERVWAMDTIYSASQIPNFIWGSFSKKYNLSEKEAMGKANDFLDKGNIEKNSLKDFLKNNLKTFDELSNLILKSNNHLFLNQNSLQRIDKIYKENNVYWSYDIATESPYPISSEIQINKTSKFSNQQNKILSLLNDLKIYSAVKTSKGIFFIVDGFTDNSYGFYYSPENKMETDNLLFELLTVEKITDMYFYYIAN